MRLNPVLYMMTQKQRTQTMEYSLPANVMTPSKCTSMTYIKNHYVSA
uniref:Uncharacterized protein n=1 Tax=Anguilla anguilla TaxID=7936 RepID=A0A0E9Q2F6_ANGAN